MKWHEFIFSNKPTYRYSRHVIFWLTWWLYFIITTYAIPHANAQAGASITFYSFSTINLIQSLLVLLIQMVGCYAVIYFLLPQLLLKGKYFLFFAGLVILGIACVIGAYFINTVIMPFAQSNLLNPGNSWERSGYWASISDGGINSIKIIVSAVAIVMGKSWWFKQKEKQRLEKEKIETELQLLKAQIQPGFLFNTLNNIYSSAATASPKAPEMLLKLSDILSYMLYECNDGEVSLAKELKMIEDYMSLEKIRLGGKLEMNILIKGSASEEKIAPLLLLHFIENSFRQCSDPLTEQPWINLEIYIANHFLGVKLMNGKSQVTETEDRLDQVKRRLQLLYPDTYLLTIAEEPEIMMVNLELKLPGLVEKDEPLVAVDSNINGKHKVILSTS